MEDKELKKILEGFSDQQLNAFIANLKPQQKLDPGEERLNRLLASQPSQNIGQIESALRGAGEGLTSGLSDEVIAGAQSLYNYKNVEGESFLDTLAKNFQKNLSLQRHKTEAAREANPIAFNASEIGTGVARDLALMGPLGAGASAAKLLGTSAAIGGLESAGRSESLKDVPENALLGGGLGLLGGGVGVLGGKLLGAAGTLFGQPISKGSTLVAGKMVSHNEQVANKILSLGGERDLPRAMSRDLKEIGENLVDINKDGRYFTITDKGHDISFVGEEAAGLSKYSNSLRARLGYGASHDPGVMLNKMDSRLDELGSSIKDVKAKTSDILGQKTFKISDIGFSEDVLESIGDEEVHRIVGGSKLKNMVHLLKSKDSKGATFSELDALRKNIDQTIGGKYALEQPPVAYNILKQMRDDLKDFAITHVKDTQGISESNRYKSLLDEYHKTAILRPLIENVSTFKTSSISSKLGAGESQGLIANTLKNVNPVSLAQNAIVAPMKAMQGGALVTSDILNATAPISIPTATSVLGADVLKSQQDPVRQKIRELFPSADEEGKLKKPLDFQLARHIIDQEANPRLRAANLQKFNASGRFTPEMLGKEQLKGIGNDVLNMRRQ